MLSLSVPSVVGLDGTSGLGGLFRSTGVKRPCGFMKDERVRVPNCLIKHVCYPTSRKLPVLEKMIWPPPVRPKEPYVYTRVPSAPASVTQINPSVSEHFPSRIDPTRNSTTIYPDRAVPRSVASVTEPAEELGNLDNTMYRFFVGTRDKNETARCRWCGAWVGTKQFMKNHHQASDCSTRLLKVYRDLPKNKCVVCEYFTTKDCWGVPLCGSKCRNSFRFKTPEVVNRAITRAGITRVN